MAPPSTPIAETISFESVWSRAKREGSLQWMLLSNMSNRAIKIAE